jgi:hypothetical protein
LILDHPSRGGTQFSLQSELRLLSESLQCSFPLLDTSSPFKLACAQDSRRLSSIKTDLESREEPDWCVLLLWTVQALHSTSFVASRCAGEHLSRINSNQSGPEYRNSSSLGIGQWFLIACHRLEACGHSITAWKLVSAARPHNKQVPHFSIFRVNLRLRVGRAFLANFQINTFTFGGTPPFHTFFQRVRSPAGLILEVELSWSHNNRPKLYALLTVNVPVFSSGQARKSSVLLLGILILSVVSTSAWLNVPTSLL